MKILVTGAAGFIGYHLIKKLLKEKHFVFGIDNINNYYSTSLKYDRLNDLGIDKNKIIDKNNNIRSLKYENFFFSRIDISNNVKLNQLFKKNNFDVVCNLAAQAGVRYSLINPKAYIKSNLNGFFNLLENCKEYKINHFVYASSSSVYGEKKDPPFKLTDKVDHPISLYAATKKSNELIAYTYSHLYNIRTTGLRFFSVYGPWGRPDMAYFLFTNSIIKNQPIKVFNNGKMERDFTYIDDIIDGIVKAINNKKRNNYFIYNLGNSNTVKLLDLIKIIEKSLNLNAIMKFYPIQKGDVTKTWADISESINDLNFNPKTSLDVGISKFVNWFKKYYKL